MDWTLVTAESSSESAVTVKQHSDIDEIDASGKHVPLVLGFQRFNDFLNRPKPSVW